MQQAVSAAHIAATAAIISGSAGSMSRAVPLPRSTDVAAAASARHCAVREARASRSSEQPHGAEPAEVWPGARSRSASQMHPRPQCSGPGSRADSRSSTAWSCRSNMPISAACWRTWLIRPARYARSRACSDRHSPAGQDATRPAMSSRLIPMPLARLMNASSSSADSSNTR